MKWLDGNWKTESQSSFFPDCGAVLVLQVELQFYAYLLGPYFTSFLVLQMSEQEW